ncbi:MAG: hypothetical protein RCG15_01090 [Candidatus Rickettsia vulgarisii]
MKDTAIKVHSNNPFIFTIILIILFVISVSYMAFYKTGLFTKKIAIKEPVENIEINNHNSEIENPKTEKEQNIASDQNHLKNIDIPEVSNNIANDTIKATEQYNPTFDNYRSYLLNANLLIINFLQDKNFSEQLLKIQSIELAPEIKNTLTDLQNYNDSYLKDGKKKATRIFPKNIPWIEKFIKVEKQESSNQEQANLKKKIMEQLDSFVNFFYSKKLEQKFIEKHHD